MAGTLALGLDRPRLPGDARQPQRAGRAPRHDSASEADAIRRGPTLDDLVVGVWEDLASHHTVTCPVCSGRMAPRYGSGARPVGGRCRRCGSSLG
jgi:DnaJ-class molecular chaperone